MKKIYLFFLFFLIFFCQILHAGSLIPVKVEVTTQSTGWVQTISICNPSTISIPLTQVEFSFNYGNAISTIWGEPWLGWQVASQQDGTITLAGGQSWVSPLVSDPNCSHPLTIQFSTTPTTASPTAPFIFKALSGPPADNATLNVVLAASPMSLLSNPVITVSSINITKKQILAWGKTWQLTSLAPGNYTVSGELVFLNQQYFIATPITVTLKNNQTTQATLKYTAVTTYPLQIILQNAPLNAPLLKLMGKNYSLQMNVKNNEILKIPQDVYSLTSNVSGYTTVFSRNPLTVPQDATLTITYQQNPKAPWIVGYYQSWSSTWATDGAETDIAKMPEWMNMIDLSFAKPDAIYIKDSLSLSGTGLQFNYANGTVLKQAIAALHKSHPATKILLAVGGATYMQWANLNATAIANIVKDFNLDGIDIDFEPSAPNCKVGSDHLVHCDSDTQFITAVKNLRAALPRPYLLTIAAFSVGAYGEDSWVNAQPSSQYTGMTLPLLRSTTVNDLDMINVMSYDASNNFNPTQALAAYTNYFPRQINMGVEVPPEAWGGHIYTLAEVTQLTNAVVSLATQKNTTPGMMIWSLQKSPTGIPSDSNPSAQMMATTICNILKLSNCNAPIN